MPDIDQPRVLDKMRGVAQRTNLTRKTSVSSFNIPIYTSYTYRGLDYVRRRDAFAGFPSADTWNTADGLDAENQRREDPAMFNPFLTNLVLIQKIDRESLVVLNNQASQGMCCLGFSTIGSR